VPEKKRKEKKSTQTVKTTPHMKLRKVSHFGTVKLLYQQTKKAQSERSFGARVGATAGSILLPSCISFVKHGTPHLQYKACHERTDLVILRLHEYAGVGKGRCIYIHAYEVVHLWGSVLNCEHAANQLLSYPHKFVVLMRNPSAPCRRVLSVRRSLSRAHLSTSTLLARFARTVHIHHI